MLKTKSFLGKSYDTWEKTVCGEWGSFMSPYPDEDNPELAHNAYVNPEGEIDVKIHIADRKLEKDKEIGLEIAFTSFISKYKLSTFEYSCFFIYFLSYRLTYFVSPPLIWNTPSLYDKHYSV